MAELAEPVAVRRLGALELFSSSRHHLGIYRCVVVTARYQTPRGINPASAIKSALASVVREQPALRVGILGEDSSAATFSHLTEIDLQRHIEWRHIDAETRDEYELRVAEVQGWFHNQLWPNVESQAPWKIICLRPRDATVAAVVNGSSDVAFVDVMFGYHHALTDGTGGKEFHQHLLAALQAQPEPTPGPEDDYKLSFPDPPRMPESQETVIPFHNSYLFLLRTVWDMLGPTLLKPRKAPVWGGRPVDFSLPYITHIRPIDFSPEMVQSFVAASRKHASTLTSAMHGLVLASLSRRIPAAQAEAFLCTTPISLRPWMSSDADLELRSKLRVLVTALDTPHPPDILAGMRAPGADLDGLIWQAGERIKAQLVQRTSTMPVNDISGLLPLISDFFDYWRGKDGKPRAATWEISNVGVLTNRGDAKGDSTSQWKTTRAMFTNGAMVTGASIGVNIVSVEGGTLTVALSWQEGVVEEALIDGVAEDLTNFIENLHNTGKFSG